MFLELMYSISTNCSEVVDWPITSRSLFLRIMKNDGKMIFPEIKTKFFHPQCFSLSEERLDVEVGLPVLSLKTSSITDFQTKKFLLPLP